MKKNAVLAAKFNVGDILFSSWGYEQTNVDFYQVVKATEKTIWIKELKKLKKFSSGMSGWALPDIDNFKSSQITMHRIGKCDFIKINSYAYAHKWDGKAKDFSGWY